MREPETFTEVMRWTAEQARQYLAEIRWPNGAVCPNGCAAKCYEFEAKTRRRGKAQPTRHLFKCSQCKRQFTATVGTIFEDSKVPLNKWLAAIWLMCASKKGISAAQLQRMLDVHYRTAWYMGHRVRHAMKGKQGKLSGIIEADETYVGGKGRKGDRKKYRDKTPVFGILERGGNVRTVVMPSLGKGEIMQEIAYNVDLESSVLVTDESTLYRDIKRLVPHETIRHKEHYVTGDDIHTQGVEGFWSRLKRQLYGTHHHVEARFLGMYADEAAFKHNTRESTDRDRFASAMLNAPGRRLSWFSSQGETRPTP